MITFIIANIAFIILSLIGIIISAFIFKWILSVDKILKYQHLQTKLLIINARSSGVESELIKLQIEDAVKESKLDGNFLIKSTLPPKSAWE
ncbi:hypothetical protein PV783_24530 [Chitinophaga sp. CC14]|uniref:hypothetical protein n=1 Tax=Chitinophaga sp. CC14 TaxID=3029199 RepID=UPI003B7F55C2